MSAAHTPGPWSIQGNIHGSLSLYGSGNVLINQFRLINQEPNARLIVAAPDLLAAVIQYRDDLRHPPSEDSVQRRLAMVNELIAKALGRTPNEIGDGCE